MKEKKRTEFLFPRENPIVYINQMPIIIVRRQSSRPEYIKLLMDNVALTQYTATSSSNLITASKMDRFGIGINKTSFSRELEMKKTKKIPEAWNRNE